MASFLSIADPHAARRAFDRFLADPPGAVPGTTMTYAGIVDARDRADLISYLARADGSAECKAPR
jgi:cytochrome c